MNICRRRRSSLTLFFIQVIVISHQIESVVCANRQQIDEEKPSLFQVVSSTITMLKKSHKTSWEKMKTIIHEFQLQFTPPNLDFRGTGGGTPNAGESDGVGEKMKEAVKKSIGTSKGTVEETAKSAADAVHVTAEKVKESVSDKDRSHDEL